MALIQIYILLSVIAAIQIMIFYFINHHASYTHFHSHKLSPASIDYTIASYPMSEPICQHTPLSLNKLNIQCEGNNKILKVYAVGITYPSKKHPH